MDNEPQQRDMAIGADPIDPRLADHDAEIRRLHAQIKGSGVAVWELGGRLGLVLELRLFPGGDFWYPLHGPRTFARSEEWTT